MQRIDAHQHFWNFDPVRDSWITEEMAVIQRDFLPQDLEPLLKQNSFDGCVVVQSDQSEEHNGFLLDLAERNEFIKGVVGWVDLRSDDINDRLSHYQSFTKMKGFRHVLQGEQDRAFMLQPSFKRGIAALQEFDFTYDILIFADELRFVPEFVNAFPDQRFIIDHIAKPDIKNQNVKDWQKDMEAAAQFSNVYCKVSGMVTEADWKHWRQQDFIPYLDAVVEAFGAERLCYGSDWPVCLVAANYQEQLGILENYFTSFTQAERAAIFGGNAIEFYKLKG